MTKQGGSLLIELALVLMLLLGLSTGVGAWLKYKAEQQKAENLAHWMLSVQQGAQRYLDAYAPQLLQTSAAPAIIGFSDAWRPTVAELSQARFLAADFVANDQLSIQVQPAGCADEICHVEALISYAEPLLTPSGHVNLEATAQWLSQAQGKGYVVYEHTPHWLSGVSRRLANPPLGHSQSLAIGTVAMLASTDTTGSLYLRIKERRNPDFQANVDVAGSVRASEDLQAGRYLYLPSLGQTQAHCEHEGSISREQTQLLLCDQGVWVQLSSHSRLDSKQIKVFFEQVLNLGEQFLPTAAGGYYGESKDGRDSMACWLFNPITKDCSCPPNASEALKVGAKQVRTHYSSANSPDVRTIQLYGCMSS